MHASTQHMRGGVLVTSLVVFVIVVVLAAMAAVFVRPIQETRGRGAETINNIKTIGQYLTARAAKRSGDFKDFPYDGKNFTLAPLAYKDIDVSDKRNLQIFFSPGDEVLALEPFDRARWAAVNKKSLHTEDFSALTSYAGRRNTDPRYKLRPELLKRKVILLCDDDQGPLHHPGGLVVCWSSGAAEYMEWEAVGIREPEDGERFLGANATGARLRGLASCGNGR